MNYREIATFGYQNKSYLMLLDDDGRYYFLRIMEDGSEQYITLAEMIAFKRIFSAPCVAYHVTKKKKRRLIPRVTIGALAVSLGLSLGSFLDKKEPSTYKDTNPVSYTDFYTSSTSEEKTEAEKIVDEAFAELLEKYSVKVPDTINSTQQGENEAPQIDDSLTSSYNEDTQREIDKMNRYMKWDKDSGDVHYKDSTSYYSVYDSDVLDELFGYSKESVTYDMIRQTAKNNPNISDQYCQYILELSNNLEKDFPNMDLRIWYENLKTLNVVECSSPFELKFKARNADSYAAYRQDENTIYTLKDYDYVPGTWNYQVIIHELCHPIRSMMYEKDGKKIWIRFDSYSGRGSVIGEAMNSLMAVRSYDEDERDIAYQLQSNIIETMVDNMDNYTYQDFVEHNITYFENKLNEQNHTDNAMEILSLMELQYKDYYDDDISVSQDQYYPIYDYVSDMYYAKHLDSSMSYEDALKEKEQLIDKVTYDVPEEYHIDLNHFSEHFDSYCENLGIEHHYVK